MTIWQRNRQASDYVGGLENYANAPKTNERTDVDATELQAVSDDLAAATRVTPFVVLRMVVDATCSVEQIMCATGSVVTLAYDPDSGSPAGVPGIVPVDSTTVRLYGGTFTGLDGESATWYPRAVVGNYDSVTYASAYAEVAVSAAGRTLTLMAY